MGDLVGDDAEDVDVVAGGVSRPWYQLVIHVCQGGTKLARQVLQASVCRFGFRSLPWRGRCASGLGLDREVE